MNFVKLFFKSMDVASRVDHKRLVNDASYSRELIEELCPDAPAAKGEAAEDRSREHSGGSLPHPA